jgi:hypothetical protein
VGIGAFSKPIQPLNTFHQTNFAQQGQFQARSFSQGQMGRASFGQQSFGGGMSMGHRGRR